LKKAIHGTLVVSPAYLTSGEAKASLRYICTVWKFQDFAITQIFREINFWDSKNAKLAILTHLEALNFDFQEFLHFLKAVIYQIDKIQSPKNGKNCSFSTSNFSKIDFT